MSSEKLESLRTEVGEASQAHQAAIDALDQAMAECLGINHTDLRCLEILIQWEEVAPSVLGRTLGLTSGSVTAMLDRLERLGYVTRSPDPADRRRILVQITEDATRRTQAIYGPIVEEGGRELERYTAPQLQLVIDFLCRSQRLYERHLARVRSMPTRDRRR